MCSSDLLEELAEIVGIDAKGLIETQVKVNEYSKTGKDLDFQKIGRASCRERV